MIYRSIAQTFSLSLSRVEWSGAPYFLRGSGVAVLESLVSGDDGCKLQGLLLKCAVGEGTILIYMYDVDGWISPDGIRPADIVRGAKCNSTRLSRL